MLSYNASTAADLEPLSLVLAEVVARAERCEVEVMVVGAAARDILIAHVLGTAPDRATADLDVAVSVRSWPDLRQLTETMENARGGVHTFLVKGLEVDVIPFGEIEDDDRTITWPNDHKMHVLGFQEAFDSAVAVTLPGDLAVRVASLPAQSLLKLLAWRDRRYANRKDAIDFKSILLAYSEGVYLEELYEESADLLEKHEFDLSPAAAERLGGQAGALIEPSDRSHVSDLLGGEKFALLVGDMGGVATFNREVLMAYREGFLSPSQLVADQFEVR